MQATIPPMFSFARIQIVRKRPFCPVANIFACRMPLCTSMLSTRAREDKPTTPRTCSSSLFMLRSTCKPHPSTSFDTKPIFCFPQPHNHFFRSFDACVCCSIDEALWTSNNMCVNLPFLAVNYCNIHLHVPQGSALRSLSHSKTICSQFTGLPIFVIYFLLHFAGHRQIQRNKHQRVRYRRLRCLPPRLTHVLTRSRSYCTAGNCKFLLLHDGKSDDSVKSFFIDVHEA